MPLYLATMGTWLLWGWELHKLRTNQPPQPQALLFLAVAFTGVSLILGGRIYKQFRNLNRGERGELHVADALEDLRALGYRPVHDLVRDRFNIDHVLVGPGGVFAIETKFRSGSGEISFRNGQGLFVGNYPEENNVLAQARGNAREVNRMIEESCGRWEWVKPLVVFAGDWRVKDEWRDTDARVFTPKQLKSYIARQQPKLTRSEIDLIASHLERSAVS